MLMRSKVLVLGVVSLVVFVAAAGAWAVRRLHHRATPVEAGMSSDAIRFPFAVPCSSDSRDATTFYAALRRHDRAAVLQMLSQDKVHLIRKETPLEILDEKPLAILTIAGDKGSTSCFIPSDVLPALESKAIK